MTPNDLFNGLLEHALPTGPVLVVAPHPDDELIGCGGALAAHRERGDLVRVLVVFDGALGDPDARFGGTAEYVSLRAREALAGGALIGLDDYRFMGLAEGHRASALELRHGAHRIAQEAQRLGAQCIYAPTRGDAHLDHHQVAVAVELALEQLGPAVRGWGYEVETPVTADRLLPIDAWAANKWAALREHASQMAYRDLVDASSRMARMRAARIDGIEAAEAFERILPGRAG